MKKVYFIVPMVLIFAFILTATISADVPTVDMTVCIALEGPRADGTQGEPIEWELRSSSGGSAAFSGTTITDENGCFLATGLPGAFYYLFVDGDDANLDDILGNEEPVDVDQDDAGPDPWPASTTTIDMSDCGAAPDTCLVAYEGDMDESNGILANDLTIVNAAFFTFGTTIEDLNEDEAVLANDLTIANSNFFRFGETRSVSSNISNVNAESPVNIYFTPEEVSATGQQIIEIFMDTNGTDVNSVQLWLDWGGSACSDVANGGISNSCADCDLTNTILPVIYEGPPAGTDEAVGIFGSATPPANGNNIKVAEVALDVTCDPGMMETLLMFEPYMDPGFGTLYVDGSNQNTQFDDSSSEVAWMSNTAIELSNSHASSVDSITMLLLTMVGTVALVTLVLSHRKTQEF